MISAKRMARAAALGAATLVGCGLYAPSAQAAYTVTLLQVGTDVVATGSGTIDTAGLRLLSGRAPGLIGEIVPNEGFITTGPTFGGIASVYTGFTGPASFGNGGETVADTGSRSLAGIVSDLSFLVVPWG